MAIFATLEEAEIRAKAKVADKTWVVAHAQRTFSGTIAVRAIRPMGPTTLNLPHQGGWVDITDNAIN